MNTYEQVEKEINDKLVGMKQSDRFKRLVETGSLAADLSNHLSSLLPKEEAETVHRKAAMKNLHNLIIGVIGGSGELDKIIRSLTENGNTFDIDSIVLPVYLRGPTCGGEGEVDMVSVVFTEDQIAYSVLLRKDLKGMKLIKQKFEGDASKYWEPIETIKEVEFSEEVTSLPWLLELTDHVVVMAIWTVRQWGERLKLHYLTNEQKSN